MPKEIEHLIEGYQEFHKEHYDQKKGFFEKLVRFGQKPKILVVACSDSRVDPALVMNCQPGDLFVVRNVANLVPPYESDNAHHGTSAALEFGICTLGIHHVIVFGHSQCGGIGALVESGDELTRPHNFVGRWMELAQPAYETVVKKHAQDPLEQKINLCSQYALTHSFKNLSTFPWIREKVASGNLFLHAWYFDLKSGKILTLQSEKKGFEELKLPYEPPRQTI